MSKSHLKSRDRRRWSALVVAWWSVWLVWPVSRVAAMPLDGVSPSSSGMPGGPMVRTLLGWGFWLGLAVCAMAIVYGAATWRGMGTNAGRGVEGKAYVAAGAIGALVIGLTPTIVSTLFNTGAAG